MLKKILMILVPLIAFAVGAFGGLQLKPEKEAQQASHENGNSHDAHAKAEDHPQNTEHASDGHGTGHGGDHGDEKKGQGDAAETFTFPSQFFVPLVRRGDPDAVMIMTISLQSSHKHIEALANQEHRLRDIILRQLLIIANTGGFDGNFTTDGRQRALRKALLEAVRHEFGETVTAILIEDIVRQQS